MNYRIVSRIQLAIAKRIWTEAKKLRDYASRRLSIFWLGFCLTTKGDNYITKIAQTAFLPCEITLIKNYPLQSISYNNQTGFEF